MTIQRITLLGSSSGRNAGDAALIAGIMDAIDEATESELLYEIPTIRPDFIRNNYRNRTLPIGMMPWQFSLKMLGIPTYRSLLRSDLALIFDAILFDRALYNPLFNYMSSLWLMLPRIKKAGKLLGCYNVGIGPADSSMGQRMLRDILEMMDFITVREPSGLAAIKDLGVTNPRVMVTADAALTLRPADDIRISSIMRSLGINNEKHLLGININAYLDTWVRPKRPSMGRERFLAAYAEGISKFARSTGATIVFIATQHHDVAITKALMERISAPVKKVLLANTVYNHHDIKGVMQRLSLLFGMRLHATILGASALLPTLGIEYQPKVRYFFELLGLPERCMSFANFSSEEIYKYLQSGWESRALIKEHLISVIPALQEEALKPATLISLLSRGDSLDSAWRQINSPQAARASAQ
jgi:polysaccharide pyruvyl transferase WcaK-like protein